MKIYITKYALTDGILERDAAYDPDHQNMAWVQPTDDTEFLWYVFKPNWHESLDDAITHAEEMRTKKIKSLQKQLRKYERMSFKPHILETKDAEEGRR